MIAIVDYRAGNLTSVRLAFEALSVEATITDSPAVIRAADRVVFPGVGAAGAAMSNLQRLGLVDLLREIVASGKPFLGICLGTQVVFDHLEEDGGVAGIGLIPGSVRRFQPTNRRDKVPQIGWNGVNFTRHHPVFDGIESGSEFYFVHSYYPAPDLTGDVAGVTDYAGVTFASIMARNNLLATQFHPEKSGRIGLRFLKNFSAWKGRLPEACSC
jgi:glutamine amidotransferase